jgi:ADP-heptose:LPS heptosyltransferase
LKILVVKRDKIGDMLLTTPMLARLRQALPGAEIDVLASDYNAWVLAGNPDVNRIWAYRRSRVGGRLSVVGALQQAITGARLRFEGYDVAIAAQGEASPRATRRARFVGAARTIAFVGAGEKRVTDSLAPPASGHERDRMMALLAPLGIDSPDEPAAPVFRPPEPLLATAAKSLAQQGLEPNRYAVIGLGARRAKKQPDKRQVLRWSEWLRREHGLDTLFMWTPGRSGDPDYPGDDEVAAPVLAEAPAHLHPFRGPLWPAIGLVWHARISLFPDSGLMHFAAASPGGVLGFFAETGVSPPPSRWAPLGPRARWLEAPACVSQIADDAVEACLAELLAS